MKFTFAPESRPLEGYTIKRAIYRGGFGEVYYALTDAGREVALKLLQNNTEVELRGVQQCLNLSHPNLVTIFDIRQDGDGDHWILMEYVAGETLDVALRRHPHGMPMEEIRRWLPGLAAGVSFLHDRGIVHRDLKPANVFIENNVVKVGDVGLSKYIAPSKRSAHTQSVGTVYYMAPEVAKGKYGKEVDVYAIGVILYEMLSGHVPFDGESTGEILMKHLSEPPNLSLLPPRLQPVVGRALEKDPARRFPTVTALAEAFERAVLGKPVVLDIPEASFVPPPVAGPHAQATAAHAAAGQATAHLWPAAAGHHGTNVWLIAGIAGLVLSTFWGIPFLAVGAMAFIAYSVHRATAVRPVGTAVHSGSTPRHPPVRVAAPPPPPAPPVRCAGAPPFAGPACKQQVVLTPRTVRAIPFRSRVAHFAEGAAVAAVLTAVFTVCIAIFAPEFFGTRGPRSSVDLTDGPLTPFHRLLEGLWGSGWSVDTARIGLFGITSLVAAWCLLGASTLLEGRRIGFGLRRFIQLLIGCVVGEVAWGLSEALYVSMPDSREAMFTSINSLPLTGGAGPTWLGYLVFFGLLFGLRRWWWQTDGYRPKRFRIMSVALTMLVAAGVMWIFEFDFGWGLVWAGVISSVVQLSSAWTPPAARTPGSTDDRTQLG